MEAETYVMLTIRLEDLKPEDAAPALQRITEISKMLTSMRNKLKSKDSNS